MSFVQRLSLSYLRAKLRLAGLVSAEKAARLAFRIFCTPQGKPLPEPPIFREAEPLDFLLEGKRMHGYRWNHPAGKKLLLLHGFGSSAFNFEPYIEPLVAKGYEVLAFDAPAHGRSAGKSINVLTYRNLVLEVCRRFGPITSFLTHSFGGLSAALALEELVHDASWKLVLIAPATETWRARDHFFRLMKLDAAAQRAFEALIQGMGGQPSTWYSIARASEHIRAQVLFLQDEDDQVTPMEDVAPIMRKGLAHFHFVITRGLGHRRIYRDARSVETVLDFL